MRKEFVLVALVAVVMVNSSRFETLKDSDSQESSSEVEKHNHLTAPTTTIDSITTSGLSCSMPVSVDVDKMVICNELATQDKKCTESRDQEYTIDDTMGSRQISLLEKANLSVVDDPPQSSVDADSLQNEEIERTTRKDQVFEKNQELLENLDVFMNDIIESAKNLPSDSDHQLARQVLLKSIGDILEQQSESISDQEGSDKTEKFLIKFEKIDSIVNAIATTSCQESKTPNDSSNFESSEKFSPISASFLESPSSSSSSRALKRKRCSTITGILVGMLINIYLLKDLTNVKKLHSLPPVCLSKLSLMKAIDSDHLSQYKKLCSSPLDESKSVEVDYDSQFCVQGPLSYTGQSEMSIRESTLIQTYVDDLLAFMSFI